MIVKIGNTYYNSAKEPVLLVLSDEEKKYLSMMGDQKKFCSFPESMSETEAREFMKVPEEIIDMVNYDNNEEKGINRLEEITNEVISIEKSIKELNNKLTTLRQEKEKIIQSNCEHVFEFTGYGRFNKDTNTMEDERYCNKCGLTDWYKY